MPLSSTQKETLYLETISEAAAVCADLDDSVAIMASLVSILKSRFDYFFWVGFYRKKSENELIIGPYQGSLACLFIPFNKGVCGKAASSLKTQIVADVDQFPGHIACDLRSKSEIVVPFINSAGELVAVLDVDSDEYNAFCE